MKKFYTDALISAYMAETFNVKLQFDGRDADDWEVYKEVSPRTEGHLQYIIGYDQTVVPVGHYYIHEDSLPIFEPQVDDQVYCHNMYKTYRVISEAPRYPHEIHMDFAKESNVKIILRDGKQFFHPQSEDS